MGLLKKICLLLIFSLHGFTSACAGASDPEGRINSEDPFLGVSLGSWCEAAHITDFVGLRKAAFPLDWITSMDIEKTIKLLDDDFQHFLDDDFLREIPNEGGGAFLWNTYYELQFRHEDNLTGDGYATNIGSFKEKYQRRIDRFRSLEHFKGKVYFVRACWTGPFINNVYHHDPSVEIPDHVALRLYDAVKRRFPNLNFTLVIVNGHGKPTVEYEKKICDGLVVIRELFYMDYTRKVAGLKHVFARIMREDQR